MIIRSQLTTTTPNTLILGVAHNGQQTAITGTIRLRNGNAEDGVIEMVGSDLWQTVNEALAELRIIKVQHLMLLTTAGEFYQWLQRPIRMEQPEQKTVWIGREAFHVQTGGNEHQWAILRHLFIYVWRCEKVTALRKAEALWAN